MILTDKRILAAKLETTPGTAVTVASSDFDCLVRNVKMSPNVDMYTRKYATGDHGWHASVPGMQTATIDFEFDLQYSGTPQTPPKWGKFLQSAGLVQTVVSTTGVKWLPDIANDSKTLTIVVQDVFVGDTAASQLQYTFKGCVASSAKFVLGKLGEPIKCVMQYKGSFVSIADITGPSPLSLTSPDTALPDSVLSATITKGGVVQKIGKFELDFGNKVGALYAPADATGISQYVITGREPKLSWDPEANLIAVDPVYTQWVAGTTVAVSIATANFTITAPVAQVQTVSVGDREGYSTYEQVYKLCRSSGNDEFKLAQKVAP